MKNDEMEKMRLEEILKEVVCELKDVGCSIDELRKERRCLLAKRSSIYSRLLFTKAKLEKSGKKKPKR